MKTTKKRWIIVLSDRDGNFTDYGIINDKTKKEAESASFNHIQTFSITMRNGGWTVESYDDKQAEIMMKYLKLHGVERVDDFRGMMLPKTEQERLSLAGKIYLNKEGIPNVKRINSSGV